MTTQLDTHQKAMLVSIAVQSLADDHFQRFGRQPVLSDLRRVAALSWHHPQWVENLVRVRNGQAAHTFTRGLEQYEKFRDDLRKRLQPQDSHLLRRAVRRVVWEVQVTWGGLMSSMESLRLRLSELVGGAARRP